MYLPPKPVTQKPSVPAVPKVPPRPPPGKKAPPMPTEDGAGTAAVQYSDGPSDDVVLRPPPAVPVLQAPPPPAQATPAAKHDKALSDAGAPSRERDGATLQSGGDGVAMAQPRHVSKRKNAPAPPSVPPPTVPAPTRAEGHGKAGRSQKPAPPPSPPAASDTRKAPSGKRRPHKPPPPEDPPQQTSEGGHAAPSELKQSARPAHEVSSEASKSGTEPKRSRRQRGAPPPPSSAPPADVRASRSTRSPRKERSGRSAPVAPPPLTPSERVEKLSLVLSPAAVPLADPTELLHSAEALAPSPTREAESLSPTTRIRADAVNRMPAVVRGKLLTAAELEIQSTEAEIRALRAALEAIPLEKARMRAVLDAAEADDAAFMIEPVDAGHGGDATPRQAPAETVELSDRRAQKAAEAVEALGNDDVSHLWQSLLEEVTSMLAEDVAEVKTALAALAAEQEPERQAREAALSETVLRQCLDEVVAARDAFRGEAQRTVERRVAESQKIADRLIEASAEVASKGLAAKKAAVEQLEREAQELEEETARQRKALAASTRKREKVAREFEELKAAVEENWVADAAKVEAVQREIDALRAEAESRRTSRDWEERLATATSYAVAEATQEADARGAARLRSLREANEERIQRLRETAERKFQKLKSETSAKFSQEFAVVMAEVKKRRDAQARRAEKLQEVLDLVEEQLAALQRVGDEAEAIEHGRADALKAELTRLRNAVFEKWDRENVPVEHRIKVLKESLAGAPADEQLADAFARKRKQVQALREVNEARERTRTLERQIFLAEALVEDPSFVLTTEERRELSGGDFILPQTGSPDVASQVATLYRQVENARMQLDTARERTRVVEAQYRMDAARHFGDEELSPQRGQQLGLDAESLPANEPSRPRVQRVAPSTVTRSGASPSRTPRAPRHSDKRASSPARDRRRDFRPARAPATNGAAEQRSAQRKQLLARMRARSEQLA